MFFKFNRFTQGSFGPQYRNKSPVLTKAANNSSFGQNFNLNRFNTTQDDLTSDSVLEQWLPSTPILMHKLFRIIHRFDSVAGPAVDLISIMPFSDVTLTGINDKAILDIYEQSIEELHLTTLLPDIASEFMVIGRVIGSLLFDSTRGIWTDIIIQDPDFCEITNIPLRGHDPKIDLKVSGEFKEFLRSRDPRDMAAKKEIPKDFINQLEKYDTLPLDPASTLYLPRQTTPYDFMGSSIYNRILPFFALEKTLINGTLVGAKRRQRSILHITVGETDLWEPDEEDISTIAGMFMQADEDPQGAIVATRMGVETNEVRCLEGKTLISTDKGLIEIQKIIPNYKSIKNPVSLPIDIKVKGLDGSYVKADMWHYQGVKPTFNYYTNSGYKINCTENHKFLTVGELANLDLVRIGDIKNSYICIENKNINNCNNKQLSLDINIPETINMNRKSNSTITIPEYMTPELAYLFGITVSEGWIGERSIEISNTDKDILNKTLICIKKVFNKTVGIQKRHNEGTTNIKGKVYKTKSNFSIVINSKFIINIFNQLGVLSTNYIRSQNNENSPSYYKEVPWSILQADHQSKLAFLAAYIDGDGSVINSSNKAYKAVELSFFSTSKKILNSIKILLSSMGYYSSIQEGRVYLSTSNGSRLYNELFSYISCDFKKKHKVCGSPVNRLYGIPFDVFIPALEKRQVKRFKKGTLFINDEGNEVFIEGGWKYLFRHYIYSKSYFLYTCYKEGKYKKELDIIKQVSNKLYTNLINLFSLEYKFEKIVKCAEGKEVPCYDISIEKTFPPVFVANGILVKNSGSDFWKISDEWDFLSNAKMRALGINESFLCITGDSLIPTEKGILRIDEIADSSIKDEPVDIDITVSSKNGNAKASKWYYRGISDVIETKSKSGRVIKSTENHKVLVLINNDLIWKKTKDLKIDDLLCVSLNKCINNKDLKLNFPSIIVNKHATNLKIPKAPEYMTPDLAFILGLLVSEGCCDKDRVRFSNSDINLLDKYKFLIKKIFNLESEARLTYEAGKEIVICGNKTTTTKDCYEITVWSNVLSQWMNYLGINISNKNDNLNNKSKHMCWNKTIPWCILQADEESQLSYLAAYIEGDGSIQKEGKSISFYSRCLENLRQIQIILASHGILSLVLEKYYRLILSVPYSCELYSKLEKYLVSKHVENFVYSKNGYRKLGIPTKYLVEFLKDRKTQSTSLGAWFKNDDNDIIFIPSWGIIDKSRWNYLLYKSYKEGMYNDFLDTLKKISEIEYNKIIKLFNSNYYFDKIVEQSNVGKHKLYDISMSEGNEPAFVANSLVLHNSGDATYNTMETALTVFIETLRTFRDNLINKIFYEKLFPTLAEIHGFKKRTQAELSHRIRIEGKSTSIDSNLIIPQINFHKQLRPEADSSYLDILSTMEEKGIPIPLRTWSAAGGLSLEKLMDMKEEDLKNRSNVKGWLKVIRSEEGEGEGEGEEGGGGSNTWGSTQMEITSSIKNALDTLPVWIQNKFLGIRKETFVSILKSSSPVKKLQAKFKSDTQKIATGNYILHRLGISELPLDISAVKNIAEHLKKCVPVFSSRSIKGEFMALNKIIRKYSNKSKRTPSKQLPDINTDKNLYIGM